MNGVFTSANELVVATSRTKLVLAAIGSAAFVVVGCWLIVNAELGGLLVAAAGFAGVVFFGACGIYALIRLARPTPAVVINALGILDNASALSVGFIEWSEIQELREYRFRNQVFLGIYPKDIDAFLATQSAWKRMGIRANLRLGTAPANIPQAVLPMSVSQLLEEIELRFRRQPDA